MVPIRWMTSSPLPANGMRGPDGKLKALWVNTDVRVLYYRKDLVANPPKTWDDLIAQAAELSKRGLTGYLYPGGRGEGAVMEHLPMFWSQGGELVDAVRQARVRRRQELDRHAEPARIPQAHRGFGCQPQSRRELQVRGRPVPRDPARQRRDVPRRQLDGEATARPRRQARLGRRADPADVAGRSRHRGRWLDLCRVHARCQEAGHHHRPDQQPGCRPGRDGGVHRGDRQPSDADERRAGRQRLREGSDCATSSSTCCVMRARVRAPRSIPASPPSCRSRCRK